MGEPYFPALLMKKGSRVGVTRCLTVSSHSQVTVLKPMALPQAWAGGRAAAVAMLTERIASQVSDHIPSGKTHECPNSRGGWGRPPLPCLWLWDQLCPQTCSNPPEAVHLGSRGYEKQLDVAPRQCPESCSGLGGHTQPNTAARAFQPLMGDAQMFVLGIIIQVHFCSNQRVLGSGINRLTKPVLRSS